jgi:hypothetical protein
MGLTASAAGAAPDDDGVSFFCRQGKEGTPTRIWKIKSEVGWVILGRGDRVPSR